MILMVGDFKIDFFFYQKNATEFAESADLDNRIQQQQNRSKFYS